VQALFVNLFHDLVKLGSQFVVVFFFEVGPYLSLLRFLLSFFHKSVELSRNFAAVDELLHLFEVLLPHVIRVCRILSFQEDSEQFQHGFLHRQSGILQSVLSDFSEASCYHLTKGLLHESNAVRLFLQRVQEDGVLGGRHLDGQFGLVVPRRVHEEAVGFFLGGEHEASVLEVDHDELVAFLETVFVFQGHRAVASDALLL